MTATTANATTLPKKIPLPENYVVPPVAPKNPHFELFEKTSQYAIESATSEIKNMPVAASEGKSYKDHMLRNMSRVVEVNTSFFKEISNPNLDIYVSPPCDTNGSPHSYAHFTVGGSAAGASWITTTEALTKEILEERMRYYFQAHLGTGQISGFNVVMRPEGDGKESMLYELYICYDIGCYNPAPEGKYSTKKEARRVYSRISVYRTVNQANLAQSFFSYGGTGALMATLAKAMGVNFTSSAISKKMVKSLDLDLTTRWSIPTFLQYLGPGVLDSYGRPMATNTGLHDWSKLYKAVAENEHFHPDMLTGSLHISEKFREEVVARTQSTSAAKKLFFNYQEHGSSIGDTLFYQAYPELEEKIKSSTRYSEYITKVDEKVLTTIQGLGLSNEATIVWLDRFKAQFKPNLPYSDFVNSRSPFTILQKFQEMMTNFVEPIAPTPPPVTKEKMAKSIQAFTEELVEDAEFEVEDEDEDAML